MPIKTYIKILFILLFVSCEGDDTVNLSENVLSDYLEFYSNRTSDEVIACAAANQENSADVNVYYYPIIGSSDIRYYETASTNVDPNNFSNYTLQQYNSEPVLGGKLAFFLRKNSNEAWGVVTFLSEGKVHKSNPIRLKQLTNGTTYSSAINIDTTNPLTPVFTWEESSSMEDVIYFQALAEKTGPFVSGTYTTDLNFTYYKTNNVVLTINTESPPALDTSIEYTMNIMAVSEDNWVNLHLIKDF